MFNISPSLPPVSNVLSIHYFLVQNPYDAQKALRKNGIQLNNFLIVGVKPVDPMHREPLKEAIKKLSNGGFVPSRPGALTSSVTLNQSRFLARPILSKSSSTSTAGGEQHGTVSLATPSKLVVSKIMDLMFGVWFVLVICLHGLVGLAFRCSLLLWFHMYYS